MAFLIIGDTGDKIPYITIESGALSNNQKEELIKRLTEVSFEIKAVSEWLGVSSFTELNKRLPDVAAAIYEHDTTGMAEPFTDIANF